MKPIVEKCGYCGACVSVCPNNFLELAESGLKVYSGCKDCGTCVVICPLGALVPEVINGL
jgi:ferredoxin